MVEIVAFEVRCVGERSQGPGVQSGPTMATVVFLFDGGFSLLIEDSFNLHLSCTSIADMSHLCFGVDGSQFQSWVVCHELSQIMTSVGSHCPSSTMRSGRQVRRTNLNLLALE